MWLTCTSRSLFFVPTKPQHQKHLGSSFDGEVKSGDWSPDDACSFVDLMIITLSDTETLYLSDIFNLHIINLLAIIKIFSEKNMFLLKLMHSSNGILSPGQHFRHMLNDWTSSYTRWAPPIYLYIYIHTNGVGGPYMFFFSALNICGVKFGLGVANLSITGDFRTPYLNILDLHRPGLGWDSRAS